MIRVGDKRFTNSHKGFIEAQKEAVMSHRPIVTSHKLIKQLTKKDKSPT